MTVHPGAGTKEDTLVHSLVAQIHPLSSLNGEERPGIVHRLDRDTEGLMLIAKDNPTHQRLAEQFQTRRIYKEYHAWLSGLLRPAKGEIDGFISRSPRNRKRMQFSSYDFMGRGRPASLSYELLREIEKFSLVKIILKTGRTHQIRCSFLSIRTSVVGDQLYKKPGMRKKDLWMEHGLLLVANRIRFFHPLQKKDYEFQIDLPERFIQFEEYMTRLSENPKDA